MPYQAVWPYWVNGASGTQLTVGTDTWIQWTTNLTIAQPAQPQLYTGDMWPMIWQTWVNQPITTSGTMIIGQPVWNAWQGMAQPYYQPAYVAPPPKTAWEIKRDQLVAASRDRARRARARVAERRAHALLLEILTPAQRVEWETKQGFTVETVAGRKYFIARGVSWNVKLIETGDAAPVGRHGYVIRNGSKMCAHPYLSMAGLAGNMPPEDHVLAQKLLLESDGGEEEFLAMANFG